MGNGITSPPLSVSNDVDMTDDSQTDIVTEHAAKTYVDNSIPVEATANEVQDGFSDFKFVSPARQQYHHSAAKFWIKCDAAGNIAASYNVTSITDGGTGVLTVTIATDFSSANWSCIHNITAATGNGKGSLITSQAAGSVALRCITWGTSAASDPDAWHVEGLGDQL